MTEEHDPVFRDTQFWQKRKHGKWRVVETPALTAPVADTHAHLHMLPDPALALARCAVLGVNFVCAINDPSDEGSVVFDALDGWLQEAQTTLTEITEGQERSFEGRLPRVRIAVGVHPHNASLFDDELEQVLRRLMTDERVCAVGEIGLDYHYDLSPREVQRDVFRTQLRLAKEAGLPVALHVREAHDDAFALLQEEGMPEAGVLLHCFNLDWVELKRWVDAGCYVAFGGALTFKKSEETREAAAQVPTHLLLTETDAPYMAPEPVRGVVCEPTHTLFTACILAQTCGCTTPEETAMFLRRVNQNAFDLLDREATSWQKAQGKEEL